MLLRGQVALLGCQRGHARHRAHTVGLLCKRLQLWSLRYDIRRITIASESLRFELVAIIDLGLQVPSTTLVVLLSRSAIVALLGYDDLSRRFQLWSVRTT